MRWRWAKGYCADWMPVPDRYEPLPGIAELPGWLWRKAGRGVRIAIAVAVLGAVALAIVLVPVLVASSRDRAAAERLERAQARAERARALEAEQRPRFERSAAVVPARAAPRRRLAARRRVMDDVAAAVLADARRRVRRGALKGPIRHVDCAPFPRTATAGHEDLSQRHGRYACVAVTSSGTGSVLGHPYRTSVDFRTGRYAYCKIAGAPGPEAEPLVTIPRECGGM